MTETDAKSVEHTRFLRELRKLMPAAILTMVALEAIARGLWDTFITRFMPSNAPRGDVGRWTNEDIAEGVGWLGDADELVEAMIRAGRLAQHAEHRLIVVDWHRLAPAYLRSNIKHVGGFVTLASRDRNEDRNAARKDGRNDGDNGGLSPPVFPSLSSSNLPSSSWEAVEGELLKLRMAKASVAVAEACGRGLSVGDAWALIDEWRRGDGAWDVGALFRRLAGGLAEWPPVDPKHQRRAEREATDRRHELRVAERDKSTREKAADDERIEGLKAKHRAAIEVMPEQEIVRRLETKPLIDMYRRKQLCPMVMVGLCESLELQTEVLA